MPPKKSKKKPISEDSVSSVKHIKTQHEKKILSYVLAALSLIVAIFLASSKRASPSVLARTNTTVALGQYLDHQLVYFFINSEYQPKHDSLNRSNRLLSVSPFYLILSADFLMGKAMLIPTRSL
jgi:hypothetical protein